MKSKRPAPWSEVEDITIVTDYLNMLALQRQGKSFNKSATRRALLPKLNNRSEGSIEMKRMNISAILESIGCQYVVGYKPAYNYQHSLSDTVRKLLHSST